MMNIQLKKYLTVMISCCFLQACVSASEEQSCENFLTVDEIYDEYAIFETLRYDGVDYFVNEERHKALLGNQTIIQKEYFESAPVIIDEPAYRISCYPVLGEGHVDTLKHSNFYGFGKERDNIYVLSVYDKTQSVEKVIMRFEWVNGELWEHYQFQVFKMKPLEKSRF